MLNASKEAKKLLDGWYKQLNYTTDKRYCTSHEKFKNLIKDTIFTEKNLVLEICQQGKDFFHINNIQFISFCCDELKNDRELILEVVKSNGYNIIHLKDEFKDDKDIVLEAIKFSSSILTHASDRLKDDSEVVSFAIQREPKSLSFASKRLKEDKEFILQRIKNNSNLLPHISPKLSNDVDIFIEAWKGIKENFPPEHVSFNFKTKFLLENMGEEMKQVFSQVDLNLDSKTIITNIEICFNTLSLKKELTSSSTKKTKKSKL